MVSYKHMQSLLFFSTLPFSNGHLLSHEVMLGGAKDHVQSSLSKVPLKSSLRTRCNWKRLRKEKKEKTTDLSAHTYRQWLVKSQFNKYNNVALFFPVIKHCCCYCCSAGSLAVTHSLREVHVSGVSWIFQECNQCVMLLLYNGLSAPDNVKINI